jgi:hypothetical protein
MEIGICKLKWELFLKGKSGQKLDISKIPDDASDIPKFDETPNMQSNDRKAHENQKNLKHTYNSFEVYLLKLLQDYLDRSK